MTTGAVLRFIGTEWNNVKKPRVFLHNDGSFLDSMNDRNEILYGGPYSFSSKPIILKAWAPDFSFHKEVLKIIPIWVRFPNLPLNCLLES